MMVGGSMTNPSIGQPPLQANPVQAIQSTQMASAITESASPITTKAEARSMAKEESDSSSQQNRKQNGNPNAGVEAGLRAYFADMPLMVEIARCESKFRQFGSNGEVLHGRQVYEDTGALQVNTRFHGARSEKLGYDLKTLAGNMKYSRLLQSEQGYWPWISSWPCWGKSPLSANFNAQREARQVAKAQKAETPKADDADDASGVAATVTAAASPSPVNPANANALNATASVSGAVNALGAMSASQSVVAER
jgi:hypothetical protein